MRVEGAARDAVAGVRPEDAAARFARPDFPEPNEMRLASGAPGPAYWQQRVDYVIDAALAAEAEVLTARATVTYTNNSPHELPYLWLHLEQNLFRKDSDGDLITRPGERFTGPSGFSGGFEVTALRLAPNGSSPSIPGGGTLSLVEYDTMGRLDLPAPVPAHGGRVAFEIEWSFKVPQYGADRMGIEKVGQGKIFELAQWFPAVAVYDDVYGWNTLPYLGQGEFYTNYGDYDVTISVPSSHVVAATGELVNADQVLTATQLDRWRTAKGASDRTVVIRDANEIGAEGDRPSGVGPMTWHFLAKECRTFAWASSDAFVWDGRFLAESGPEGADGRATGTFVQSFYPAESVRPHPSDEARTGQWGASSEMLAFAINGYNKKWMRYPYPCASNINGVVGGMEYPMIIFCGGRYDERGLYGVTTHEIGHNWFPMAINTDERRHAWMDEGFNTFVNYYSNAERYPEDEGGRRGDGRRWAEKSLMHDSMVMDTPADHLRRLGDHAYEKPAVAMVLLREYVLGEERFDRAFKEYLRRWWFKSPRPWDFFRTMEDAAGADLSWFWRGWFLSTAVLDQSVDGVEMDGDEARVSFSHHQDMVMPIVYRVTYSDGTSETRRVPAEAFATGTTFTASWPTPGRRVEKVEIDPEERLPDVELGNNAWPR